MLVGAQVGPVLQIGLRHRFHRHATTSRRGIARFRRASGSNGGRGIDTCVEQLAAFSSLFLRGGGRGHCGNDLCAAGDWRRDECSCGEGQDTNLHRFSPVCRRCRRVRFLVNHPAVQFYANRAQPDLSRTLWLEIRFPGRRSEETNVPVTGKHSARAPPSRRGCCRRSSGSGRDAGTGPRRSGRRRRTRHRLRVSP